MTIALLKSQSPGGNPGEMADKASAGGASTAFQFTTSPTPSQAPTIAEHIQNALENYPHLTRADLRLYSAWLKLGPTADREALQTATGLNKSTVSASKTKLLIASYAGLHLPTAEGQAVAPTRSREIATPQPSTVPILTYIHETEEDTGQLHLAEHENDQNLRAMDIDPQRWPNWKEDLVALGIDLNLKQPNSAKAPKRVQLYPPARLLLEEPQKRENVARWRAAHDAGIDITNGGRWKPALIWVKIYEGQDPPTGPAGQPPTLDMITCPETEEIPPPPPEEPPAAEASPDLPVPVEGDPAHYLWAGVDHLNSGIRLDVWNREVVLNGVQPVSLVDDILTLRAHDQRNLEMLQGRMQGALERGASAVARRPIQIQFILDGQEQPQPLPPPAEDPLPPAPLATRLPLHPEADSVVGRIFQELPKQGLSPADCRRYRQVTYGAAIDGQRLAIAAPYYVVSRFSQIRYKGQLQAAAEAAGCQVEIILVNSEEGVMLCRDLS